MVTQKQPVATMLVTLPLAPAFSQIGIQNVRKASLLPLVPPQPCPRRRCLVG